MVEARGPDDPGIHGFTPREAYILWSLVNEHIKQMPTEMPGFFYNEQRFMRDARARYVRLSRKLETTFCIRKTRPAGARRRENGQETTEK